ncbi:MAG: guanylate kinase [Chloroflexota bacterium]
MEKDPLLIVVSGPSGVGKDAVLARLRESGRPYYFVVTATTRPCRQRETDGVEYHFLTVDKFQEMIREGELLEWATVYGHLYGTPKQPVKEALFSGQDVILKVDVQGCASIKRMVPEAVFVFLAAPSLEELVQRLSQRKTESPEDLKLRIEAARREMAELPMFDYVVVNASGKAHEAAAQIEAIITAEKCRVTPRAVKL